MFRKEFSVTTEPSLIGIVIPVHNRASFLRRAIASIEAQTLEHSDWSLIVVDDASTENLDALWQQTMNAGHQWLRLENNLGPAAARNIGVQNLACDWVCFLDSDDEWFPEKLKWQWSWHQNNPNYRISQVNDEWLRNGKKVAKPKHWQPRQGNLFAESLERCRIGPSCVMIRRDLWDECGGFDESYPACEDYELWLRISCREEVGLVSPTEVLARKHAGHADQLSYAIPALDRWRVRAMLELWHTDSLEDEQLHLLKEALQKKATILCGGARKRGANEEAHFYKTLSHPIDDPASFLAQARSICEKF